MRVERLITAFAEQDVMHVLNSGRLSELIRRDDLVMMLRNGLLRYATVTGLVELILEQMFQAFPARPDWIQVMVDLVGSRMPQNLLRDFNYRRDAVNGADGPIELVSPRLDGLYQVVTSAYVVTADAAAGNSQVRVRWHGIDGVPNATSATVNLTIAGDAAVNPITVQAKAGTPFVVDVQNVGGAGTSVIKAFASVLPLA